MTAEQFDIIIAQAREIAFGKTGDGGKHAIYNANDLDLYKATGMPGRVADIWRKSIRLISAMHLNTYDHLEEDLLDLIVYSTLALVVLRDDKYDFPAQLDKP